MIRPEDQDQRHAERTASLRAAVDHFTQPDKAGAARRRLVEMFGPYWVPRLFASHFPGGSALERRLDRRSSDAAQ